MNPIHTSRFDYSEIRYIVIFPHRRSALFQKGHPMELSISDMERIEACEVLKNEFMDVGRNVKIKFEKMLLP